MKKREIRLLIWAAFRYSLGRRTYMPEFVVENIIKNQKLFDNQDWKHFIEEIRGAETFGDRCDEVSWNNLLRFCEERCKEDEND